MPKRSRKTTLVRGLACALGVVASVLLVVGLEGQAHGQGLDRLQLEAGAVDLLATFGVALALYQFCRYGSCVYLTMASVCGVVQVDGAGPWRAECLAFLVAGLLFDVYRGMRRQDEIDDRFRRAVAGSTDGFWDYSPADGSVWYSDRFRQLMGFEAEESHLFPDALASWQERLHPDDHESTWAAVHAHLHERTPFNVCYRLRVRSGEYRWFRARGQAVWDKRGAAVRMAGSIVDVHEQRTAALRLDLAVESANAGIWDWDVQAGTFVTNATYHSMVGYPSRLGELPLDYFLNNLHPDDLAPTVAAIGAAHRSDAYPYDVEFRFRCNDGGYRWIRSTGKVIERSAAGEALRMLGQHIDVDVQTKTRSQVERLNVAFAEQGKYATGLWAKAEAASRAKSDFLANMSHEIRTPLTAILGYGEMLLEEAPSAQAGDARSERVANIVRSAERLLSIINDILDVSKVEAWRLSIEKIAVNPVKIVKEVAELMRPRAAAKGVELRIGIEDGAPAMMLSDPTRLRQIFINLVGNAVKFTEAGSVEIRAALEPEAGSASADADSSAAQTPPASQRKSLPHRPSRIRFSVVDTGIGMTPAECEEVRKFDPFSQANGSMARKFGGSGLGLRIANTLVSMLGGELSFESTPGSGSLFTVIFPTGEIESGSRTERDESSSRRETPPDASAPTPSAGGPEKALQGLRLLLAEDGPDNQRIIRFVLQKAGAEVEVVENGQLANDAALAALEAGRPFDAVLMDIQMPVMDGYAATRALRSQDYRLPIIALTAPRLA